MKKIKFLFILLATTSLFSQENVDIKIKVVENQDIRGKSSGDKKIQFIGYRLYDVLSEISDIPTESFVLSNNDKIKNHIINFTATSENSIDKSNLIDQTFKHLKDQFGIQITIEDINKEVYTFQINRSNLKKCPIDVQEKSLSLNNDVLVGKCIDLKQLRNIIKAWYKNDIYINLNDNQLTFNIKIKKINTWEAFISELSYQFGINIIKTKKKIQQLSISS